MTAASVSLLRTPLRDFHARHGARLVDFAGWEMPVQYRSILEEHKAVRQAAGLFDVSHMGEFDVRGPDAARFLDHVVTNDVSRLFPGRILYSPMCDADGGVIDDLLIYMRGPEDYFLCVNAGNIAADFAWLREQAAAGDFDVALADRSAGYGLLAIQGPRAAGIVQALTDAKLDDIRTYHFGEGAVAGVPCLLSRTGYTGEDGFELYHAADEAVRLAEALLEAGRPHGLVLAGLGARDSLRLEAGYPLYGHELSPEISPLAAGFGWTVKLDKRAAFVGSGALRAEKLAGSRRRVVWFRLDDRRIARADTPVLAAGGDTVAGRVLSGTLSPVLNTAIGSALVDASLAESPLEVDIRGTRLALRPVKPPFVPLRS
ncbi:glycine cleavage system protein T [Opitutaceae bacterium TAV5]|nr:glycine cleavage system protein T [Opitutaceae bacterium TAV5]